MPTLVVGHLNPRDGTAELRSLEHVDAICRERFKQGAPLDPTAYAHFLGQAQSFLGAYGMRATLAGPPADLMASLSGLTPSTAPPRSRAGLVFAVTALVLMAGVLGAALSWFFLRK